MPERRTAARHRAFIPGVARVGEGTNSVFCTVRDLSSAGALLAFGKETKLPEAFSLVVPSRGLVCEAEVRWRRGREIGVRFTETVVDHARARTADPRQPSGTAFRFVQAF